MIQGETTRILDSPYDMRAHISYEALNDPDLAPFRELVKQFDDLTNLIIRSGQESGQFNAGDPWLELFGLQLFHQIHIGLLGIIR